MVICFAFPEFAQPFKIKLYFNLCVSNKFTFFLQISTNVLVALAIQMLLAKIAPAPSVALVTKDSVEMELTAWTSTNALVALAI